MGFTKSYIEDSKRDLIRGEKVTYTDLYGNRVPAIFDGYDVDKNGRPISLVVIESAVVFGRVSYASGEELWGSISEVKRRY